MPREPALRQEEPPDLPSDHCTVSVMRQGLAQAGVREQDEIAREVPIAFEYNGIGHAVVLATPCDIEDLLYGFSFTEGVIRSARDIYDVETTADDRGIIVRATIASACLDRLKQRRRSLAGRTGCGLCGLESLGEVQRELGPLPDWAHKLSSDAVFRATGQLRMLQPIYATTGATHASGWADLEGDILIVREDVGRHNALDKLIGHMLRTGRDTGKGFAVISSRASFEMVQKAAATGVHAVVAVSAPTSYAVALAEQLNLMLAAFAREQRFTVYTHPEYLLQQDNAA